MTPCQSLSVSLWISRIALLLCLIVLTACAGRSAPAPVTTLELRKQQIAQRQQAELSGNQYIVQRGDTLYSIAFRAGQDYRDWETDRKSTRLNSSHSAKSRMPSSA